MKTGKIAAIIGVITVGVLASVQQVSAASLTQTETFGFVPTGSATLTFNQFDDLGGLLTLDSITITFLLEKSGGSYQADNDSATGGSVTLTHQLQGSLSSSDVNLISTTFQPIGSSLLVTSSTNTTLTATTGDPTNVFNDTGLGDYFIFNPAAASNSTGGDVFSGVWSGYIGTGTFDINALVQQNVQLTGLGGVQQAFTVSDAAGAVTVVYNYTVPEPTTALLVGATGAFLLLARRRREA